MVSVIFTGSREWRNEVLLREVLGVVRLQFPRATLKHGACRGADQMADGVWSSWGLPTRAFPVTDAHRARHGQKRAYYVRNQAMVDTGAELCVALVLPGSKGTVMTIDLARRAGIPVWIPVGSCPP